MAGEWIKMRTNLHDDPRVFAISSATRAHKTHIVGALHWLWSRADEHSTTGRLWGYSAEQIDQSVNITGFSMALTQLKDKRGKPRPWLELGDGFVQIIRFAEHNGQSAKKRAQAAQRASRSRHAQSATKRAPREEKRRVEKNKRQKPPIAPRKPDPLFDAIAAAVYGGTVPESSKSSVAKAAHELRGLGAKPEDVLTRWASLVDSWGGDARKPSVRQLADRWARLAPNGSSELFVGAPADPNDPRIDEANA